MKLFEITNGWMGNSYVRVLVIAENEEDAKTLAIAPLKKDGKNQGHGKKYWTQLECKPLCEDVSNVWVGDANDE